MLMLLEEFEAGDQYEDCAAILEGIRLHNARSNDKLPTNLTDAFILEVEMVSITSKPYAEHATNGKVQDISILGIKSPLNLNFFQPTS